MHRLHRTFFTGHLNDDEECLLIVHKHWLVGMRFLFWPSVALLLGIFLLWFFRFQANSEVLFLIVSVVCVAVMVWWLRNFFDYYLDAWVITDQGIVDVEWHGWFHRETTRVLYSDVQGVSTEVKGVWATLFRYGTIAVEKISSGEEVVMEFVPRPRIVEREIFQNMEDYLHGKNLKDAKHVQELLSKVLVREMQMRDLDDEEEDEYEEEDDEDER